MSGPRRNARRRILVWLGVALVIALILFGVSLRPGGAAARIDERVGQPVAPSLPEALANVQIISVSTADSGYTIRRDGDTWVMLEAGRYPVREDRLRTLEQGISSLVWQDAKTRDPEKYERIGVGDPSTGGNGALLELLGPNKEVFVSLIVGRRDEQLYVRAPDAATAWLVDGELPPLLTREAWLDLDVVSMDADTVASVRLIAPEGDSVRLVRQTDTSGNTFSLSGPFDGRRLVSPFAAIGPALALTRLSPLGAKPAAALETAPLMRHITATRDGLEVIVDAYRDSQGGFITIRAVEAGGAAQRARSINNRAEGWAYRLTDYDWADFAKPIAEVVTETVEN